MRALGASIVAALALAVAAPAARADEAEDAALLHLDRGVGAFRAGDYARAHRELSAAQELAPDRPNPYRWLALTEVQLGDCASALVHIEEFLARVPPEDERVAELVRLRELCENTGALTVESTPPSVSLRIDDVRVGATPFRSLSMRAGTHVLVGEKPGYRRASRSIVLEPGGEVSVHLALEREPTPLTRRRWFWPVVVGVAAAATATIVVVATRDPGETLLPPVRCDDAGCSP